MNDLELEIDDNEEQTESANTIGENQNEIVTEKVTDKHKKKQAKSEDPGSEKTKNEKHNVKQCQRKREAETNREKEG